MSGKYKITKGERLFIYRRRLGLTQVEAAKHWKVSPDTYRDWEGDRRAGQPQPALERVHPNEACVILRRRARVTQRELARKIGVSRLWIVQMENGEADSERLQKHWGVA